LNDLTWKTLHGFADEKIIAPAATSLVPATQLNLTHCVARAIKKIARSVTYVLLRSNLSERNSIVEINEIHTF
jgi:hypothetical protein